MASTAARAAAAAAAAAGVSIPPTTSAAGLSQYNEAAERPYGGSSNVNPQDEPRQNPFTDPANSFNNRSQADSPPSPISKDAPIELSPVRDLTPSPTDNAVDTTRPPAASGSSPGPIEAAGAGAVAGAAVTAAAAAAVSRSDDKPVEARTPSPEYVETPGSRPQSPVVGGAPFVSNVHRVQLDFAPSLADEMELRAGQLVRLLKSYDDGWVRSLSLNHLKRELAFTNVQINRPNAQVWMAQSRVSRLAPVFLHGHYSLDAHHPADRTALALVPVVRQ